MIVVLLCGSAQALQMIERDGFIFYFPHEAAGLAESLIRAAGPISAFLADHGLPVAAPLHIVLDDDLDEPEVRVLMFPHREIRIPMRAPGALEDGFLQADPWERFLFMGLSTQGIYNERSGVPAGARRVFGEIVSPNMILPDWTIDGISHLLYEAFTQNTAPAPLQADLLAVAGVPGLDRVSNHPEIWPGRHTYRIFGRPFMRWLHQRYGWDKLLAFLKLHGRGLMPIEIDQKLIMVFGKSANSLWNDFKDEHPRLSEPHNRNGLPVTGYWPRPFVYWNDTGVFPGPAKNGLRGRYGFVDQQGWLWVSQYEAGKARVRGHRLDAARLVAREHVWDPGPGGVAVTRKGRRPYLLIGLPDFSDNNAASSGLAGAPETAPRLIEAPLEVIQLSGPVMDRDGRIAVAGNTGGNWDIWLYDGGWSRVTTAPSVEIDPWLSDGRLVFASNADGRFRIVTSDFAPLTPAAAVTMLPRLDTCLQLNPMGWTPRKLPSGDRLPVLDRRGVVLAEHSQDSALRENPPSGAAPAAGAPVPYSPAKSLLTNYALPDLFIDDDRFQFGLTTTARDVSGVYAWDAAFRYDAGEHDYSWSMGGKANGLSLRTAHYPFAYRTQSRTTVDESRLDAKAAWSPPELPQLEVSANYRRFADQNNPDHTDEDLFWGALAAHQGADTLTTRLTLDLFTDNSLSLYGELVYWFGQNVTTMARLSAGKTWGDLNFGHNSFRIGGNSGEGFFTQRANRLFPLRGFPSNFMDADLAATGGVEVFWPLARLQTGYRALPVFLHNISVGAFVDAGFADDPHGGADLLAGAGFELITGMELAWGFMADFRLGLAWPIRQRDDSDHKGPVFLFQIGRPL